MLRIGMDGAWNEQYKVECMYFTVRSDQRRSTLLRCSSINVGNQIAPYSKWAHKEQ